MRPQSAREDGAGARSRPQSARVDGQGVSVDGFLRRLDPLRTRPRPQGARVDGHGTCVDPQVFCVRPLWGWLHPHEGRYRPPRGRSREARGRYRPQRGALRSPRGTQPSLSGTISAPKRVLTVPSRDPAGTASVVAWRQLPDRGESGGNRREAEPLSYARTNTDHHGRTMTSSAHPALFLSVKARGLSVIVRVLPPSYPTASSSSSPPTPGRRMPSTFTFWCR